jgi:hypothetical protein
MKLSHVLVDDEVNLIDEELNSIKNNTEVALRGREGEKLVYFAEM